MNRKPVLHVDGHLHLAAAVALVLMGGRPMSRPRPPAQRQSARQEISEERKRDAAAYNLRRQIALEMTSARRERGEREQARKAAKRQRDYDRTWNNYHPDRLGGW